MNVNYFKTLWRNSLVILMFCFGLTSVWGQVSITSSDPVIETFNNFSGSSTPQNWGIQGTGNRGTAWNGTNQTGGASGGWYGNNNMSFLGAGSASNGNATWILKNDTNTTIEGFTLSFVGKMWRSQTNSPTVTVSWQYHATSSTNPSQGTLSNILNSCAFSDSTPSISSGVTLSQTVSSISIPAGAYILIRFIHSGGSNSDNLGWDDITFTPVLTPTTPSYTLTYSAGPNGTIDGDSPQTIQEGNDGTAVTAVPNEGYYFVNWSDDSIDNPRVDTNITENISVTANFAINTYTVTYNGNENTAGTAPVDENNPYNHGSNVTVLGQGNLTLTDHSFLGWNTQTDGLGTFYAENAEITNITSDITLYAQWLDESLDPQTITFDALADVTYGDADIELSASSDSGLDITYTSSNENVATIDGNMVTIVGVGTTDVTAVQLGDDDFQPAVPVVQLLTVNAKNLTISGVTIADKTYDGTTTATFDTTSAELQDLVGDDEVTFVSGIGEFASANAGNDVEVTITTPFTLTGNDASNYTLTQPTLTGNILKANQSLTGFDNITKYENDDDFNLPATTVQGLTLTYESSNTAVATVSGNTVTIVGMGTTNITATQEGNNNYNDFDSEITLMIASQPIALAQWDFTGESQSATSTADVINLNLNSGSAVLVRGDSAPASSGANSFRTAQTSGITGFRNDGINISNTDYFQTSFTSANGIVSFATIDASFVGTNSFTNSPGVTTQFAYSFDNISYTLIPSSLKITIGNSNMEQVDLSGVSALQNISAGTTVYFRFYASGQTTTGGFGFNSTSSGSYGLQFHGNIVVPIIPNLSTNISSIESLDYIASQGPSASQDFEVNGVNLDGSEITVTAPVGFEVSEDNENFDNSLNLSSTDGTLEETTIYVRLAAGLAANTYNGNITISGGDAEDVTIAVSGEVIDYCMPTSEANDESGITSVSFADINNTSVGNPLYSDFTDITAHVIAGNSYDLIVGVNTLEENTYIVKAWIDWNKNYIFDAGEQYNVGNAYNNGTTPPFSITIPVDTQVGEYRMRIRTMWEPSGVLTACGEIDYTETEDYTITVIPTPSFSLSVNSIAGFTYVAGSGPSNSESFTVSGVNLDGSAITVTVPENFEVSTDEETFSGSLNLSSTDGTLADTTIYVRLVAGLTAETYSGDITISGGGSADVVVTVSGEVLSSDPILNVSEEEITNLGYTFGDSTSTPATFTIHGLNMEDADGAIMLAFAEGEASDFEMSLTEDAENYLSELLIEDYDGTETTIYVRLKAGLAIGDAYADIIEITSDYDVDGSVLISGQVLTPPSSTTISETTLSGFDYLLGDGPSAEQSFTVEGAYLTGDITVTAPTNYQVSLTSGSGFENSVILTPTAGMVAETTVYVRLNSGLGVNSYNGNITVATTDVANKTIAVSGSVACGVITSFPFTETFENNSASRACWTQIQEVGSANWTFATGSGGAIMSAQSGSLNARFVSQNGDLTPITKLVTPVLDLTSVSAPRVNFYYGQEFWSPDQNELKVYYRISPSDSWVQIAHYTNNISSWTQEILNLPNPSATYQIAFEGINNHGRANVLDSVTIESTPALIEVNPVIVPAFTAVLGSTDSENITVTGLSLSENINISLSGANADQFSLSSSTLGTEGGTLTITYEPTTVGNHSATITLSSTSADDVILTINGTSTLGVPVATEATLVNHNSFTANWETVTGATSYDLYAYTKTSGINDTATEVFKVTGGGSQPTAPAGWSYTNIATSNDYIKMLPANSGGGAPTMITPILNVTNFTTLKINAEIATFGSPSNAAQRTITISVSTNDGPWNIVGTIARSSNDGSNYESKEVILNDYIGYSQLRIKFEALNATTGNGPRLKNIILSGIENSTVLNPVGGSPFNSIETSYQVTGLDPENTYHYVVRAVTGAETSTNSNEITVETLPVNQVVWTTNNEWLNFIGPTINDDVIIEGTLIVGFLDSFNAKTLTVNGSLTILEGGFVAVAGKITNNNGSFTVANDGVLIQTPAYTGTNEGAITVFRQSNDMKRLDYTLWSSPVSGMLLKNFSDVSPSGGSGTLWNRVYTLGATAWNQVWAAQQDFSDDTTTIFTEAKGYLYRSRNDFPTTPTEFTGEFTGVPHNGDISIATSNDFDAIGNPYPSPIYADDLLAENPGILYFWTNVNAPVDGSYTKNNWAYYVAGMGGVGVALGDDTENLLYTPEDEMLIQPGQGFVIGTEETTVEFNNTMRRGGNGNFFRIMSNERHRFWLNLSNEEVVFNQILVGYIENATQGVDTGIDGKMFAYEGNALYSIIENSDENYVIQGRSLPFTASDFVTLGFRAVNAGSFTISLHNLDGLFADNQNIYLKDNFTQALHNLKDGAYTFVSEEGVFNTRFEVVYQTAMSVENPIANNSNWIVYSQENGFQVQTQGFDMKAVQVYDLLGRTIYTAEAEGTVHQIPSLGANGVYIVKITSTENVVLSKKVR